MNTPPQPTGNNRLTGYLPQPSTESSVDDLYVLREKLLQTEIELAGITIDLKIKMAEKIMKLSQTDPVIAEFMEKRDALLFQAKVCGREPTPEETDGLFNVNATLVAALNDFDGMKEFAELIEERKRISRQAHQFKKAIHALYTYSK